MRTLKIALGIFMAAILIFGTAAPVYAANISSLGSKVSTQKKYTMYLGTNDKDTGAQEIPTDTNTPIDALKKIMDEALAKFNQSSILLEESKGRSTFYNGKSHD